MKSKTISISCIGGSVGLAWEHSIIARQRKNKIYTTVALDEQIEKWSAEGSNLFEYLADLLSESSLEDELHIDYECLNESCVTVNGLDGWKKNYIIFCYGRNEEKQCSYGWFFDGLSENELKKIFINFKNINEIKDFILEIDKILTNLNDINFIQKELIKYGKLRKFHYYPDTLIELAEIFNINRNNNIYRELKKKVSKLYNKYFSKIPDLY